MHHAAPTRPSIRSVSVLGAVLAGLLTLSACGSGGSSAAPGTASAVPVSTSTATSLRSTGGPTAAPSTDVERANAWCSALAARLGGGLQSSASRPVLVRDLDPAEARAIRSTWPAATLLAECAIGLPLRYATPEPTVARDCPSGHATTTVFPPTRAWLTDASSRSVELPKGTGIAPRPLTQCT